MRRFLEEILTPAERKDLALRWQLMQMLQAGVSQRKIASDLGISLCKITRGAKILKDPASVTKRYLESRRTQ
jgi:TrpR family trp operon transcriptional repressor